jgi:hypothetical protein
MPPADRPKDLYQRWGEGDRSFTKKVPVTNIYIFIHMDRVCGPTVYAVRAYTEPKVADVIAHFGIQNVSEDYPVYLAETIQSAAQLPVL